MKVIVLVIGLLTSLSGLAQTGLPPVYEISKDTTDYPIDTAHFQLLEDLTGKLTIDQVSQPALSGRFYYDAFRNKSRKSGVYWLRMRIRNNLPKPVQLLYNDSRSDYSDVYTRADTTRWEHRQGGNLRPRSERTLHRGIPIQGRFPVDLMPEQTRLLYLRSEVVFWHPRRTYISPDLVTEQARMESYFRSFQTDEWQAYLFNGLMLGILLLAAVSNVLIFTAIRDRTYLYFGISLLFFGLARNQNVVQQAFFPENPYLFELAASFFFVTYYVFFIQSLRTFLNPLAPHRTLNRLTTFFLLLLVLLSICQLITVGVSNAATLPLELTEEVFIRIVYLLVFILNVRVIRQGFTQARSSLIATLPLFSLWLVTLTSRLSGYFLGSDLLLGDIFIPDYIENACFAWLIIFFSGALVGRYNQVTKQVSQQVLEREQFEREQAEERNRLVASQNEQLERQVAERTAELQTSLDTLKATQAQLIQSEKMASLGELTAGIAHEIQNPLNFVNNFAEVSAELVGELEDEQQKPTRDPDLETDLLSDLKLNLQRISQHGNRASNIVRGMLEHARTTTGQKIPTDLNALCDEYLRLSYHGLRRSGVPAKDKTFTCELITRFDPQVNRVNVIPQDMGRVVLNLVNNAFYAVQERQRTTPATYQPTVTIRTVRLDQAVEISVRDNGTGMSEAVKQKVFQPFFTTKPTGSGTGLGLSLSYDIVVKGHGGILTVDSCEGEGTTFTVTLPAA